jgi:17beta-estradiol 17-dehydrogenase / very-long-chain 3-oxoacyl-CoA reductase
MDGFSLSLFNKATVATRSVVGIISNEANAATKSLYEDQIGRVAIVIAVIYLGVSLLRAAFSVVNFIFIYFLRPAKNLKFYGSWAVVTGATDGIGRAYCVELAKKGRSD